MAEQPTPSVLRRKVDAGAHEYQARAMTLAKAMRQGIARVADGLMDLPMSAFGVVVEEREADACEELLAENALLMLLDGPQGRVGAAVLGPDLVAGLIQQQTTGLVRAPDGSTREMTNTDAALAAPLINALLERAAAEVEAASDRALVQGVSFGARAEEPRMVMLELEAPTYQVVRLNLDMAKGTRQGELVLILPPVSSGSGAESEEDQEEPGEARKNTFSDVVLGLKAELKIEVGRLTMALSGATRLAPGEVLRLPPDSFPKARILATDGRCVGTGSIGQVDGVRALKLDRQPIYASQPRRRIADQDELDLPKIAPLEGYEPMSDTRTLPAMSATGGGAPDPSEADLPDLPDLGGAPELPLLDADMTKGPEDGDLPDLDDLPDLSELADLPPLDLEGAN